MIHKLKSETMTADGHRISCKHFCRTNVMRLLCAATCIFLFATVFVMPVMADHTHDDGYGQDIIFDKKLSVIGGKLKVNDADPEIRGSYYLTEGNYYLDNDVNLSAKTVHNKTIVTTGTVNLCLNGHIIKNDDPYGTSISSTVIIVESGVLNIYDCPNDIPHKFIPSDDKKWEWSNSTSDENAVTILGGGITSKPISIKKDGGGIFNNAELNLYGGTIIGNEGLNGGGVYNAEGSRMTIYDGKIIGNMGQNGGGVYNAEGSRMTIYDGKIAENIACVAGGGVYTHENSNLELSGSINITENILKSGDVNNLYLPSGKTVIINPFLNNDAKIGVTTVTKPAIGTNVAISGDNAYDFAKNFIPDEVGYAASNIIAENAHHVVVLEVKQCTATFDSLGGSLIPSATLNYREKVTEPTTPVKTGYNFDAWYRNEECTDAWDFETEVMDDITLFAKWVPIDYTIANANSLEGVTTIFKKADPTTELLTETTTANFGDIVTLSTTAPEGYSVAYSVKDEDEASVPINGNRFTMPASNVNVYTYLYNYSVTSALPTNESGKILLPSGQDIILPVSFALLGGGNAGYWNASVSVMKIVGESEEPVDGLTYTYQANPELPATSPLYGTKVDDSRRFMMAGYDVSETETSVSETGTGTNLFTLTIKNTASLTLGDYNISFTITGGSTTNEIVLPEATSKIVITVPETINSKTDNILDSDTAEHHDKWYFDTKPYITYIVHPVLEAIDDIPTLKRANICKYQSPAKVTNYTVWKSNGMGEEVYWTLTTYTTVIFEDDKFRLDVGNADKSALLFKITFDGKKVGDVVDKPYENDRLDLDDVDAILRCITAGGLSMIDDDREIYGDVDHDGKINLVDACLLFNYVRGYTSAGGLPDCVYL